jgi:hypothetical protein
MRSNKWLWFVLGAAVISASALSAALTVPLVPASRAAHNVTGVPRCDT